MDDNKFVDCAVAANASFIVSHDKDFNILKEIDFPKAIIIKRNAWIAANATILQGVTIGENSVVAAGAVVRSDVPQILL